MALLVFFAFFFAVAFCFTSGISAHAAVNPALLILSHECTIAFVWFGFIIIGV